MKKSIRLLFAIMMSLVLYGCGQSALGPSAPEIQSTAYTSAVNSLSQETTSDTVNATCSATMPKTNYKFNRLKHKNKMKRYVEGNVEKWLNQFYRLMRSSWFFAEPFGSDYSYLFSNKLLRHIILKHKIDRTIATTVMEIITQAWEPGLNTNAGGFESEVTLTPYAWQPFSSGGFDSILQAGWKVIPNSTDGYTFMTTNANNDLVAIDTKSYYVDIYSNQRDIASFRWNYGHDPEGDDFYKIEFELQQQEASERLWLKSRLIDLEGTQTIIQCWRSTKDMSAYYYIFKNDGTLNLKLTFDEDGEGGGTLDILNKNGEMDHYDYTVKKAGKCYWKKNGKSSVNI